MKPIARCKGSIYSCNDPEKLDVRETLSHIDITDIQWEKERRIIDGIFIKDTLQIQFKPYACINLTERRKESGYEFDLGDLIVAVADSELDYQIDNRELMELKKKLEKLLKFKESQESEIRLARRFLDMAEIKMRITEKRIKELEEN